tara:strand:+ start:97 stop:486 length:390 start_codon:yes stop_codon:yes gene_type:complete
MHGEAPLAGNLLLDDLVSGKAAGSHASAWSSEAKFGGALQIENAIVETAAKISSLSDPGGIPVGQFSSQLFSAISSGASSKESALDEIREIKESGIKLTDSSLVMNTEMVDALRLGGLASVAEAILNSG